jgi:hypothetical protein
MQQLKHLYKKRLNKESRSGPTQGKRPAPPEELSVAIHTICVKLGIKVTHKDEHLYLMKVRLK